MSSWCEDGEQWREWFQRESDEGACDLCEETENECWPREWSNTEREKNSDDSTRKRSEIDSDWPAEWTPRVSVRKACFKCNRKTSDIELKRENVEEDERVLSEETKRTILIGVKSKLMSALKKTRRRLEEIDLATNTMSYSPIDIRDIDAVDSNLKRETSEIEKTICRIDDEISEIDARFHTPSRGPHIIKARTGSGDSNSSDSCDRLIEQICFRNRRKNRSAMDEEEKDSISPSDDPTNVVTASWIRAVQKRIEGLLLELKERRSVEDALREE